MYLLKGFLDFGFLPEVIRKGRQILLLEIKQLGLRFLTSSSYIEGDEYEIADQFNCPFEKHLFPYKFLNKHSRHKEIKQIKKNWLCNITY